MNTSTFSTNDMFARIVAQYPTYDAFRTYVTSLGIQVNGKEGDQLVMLRYNRAPVAGAAPADTSATPRRLPPSPRRRGARPTGPEY